MSDHELHNLRRELAIRGRGRGKVYEPTLRLRITDWARRAIARGMSVPAAASALPVHPETLHAWLASAPATTTALVPVQVIAETPESHGGLRVVSPAGFRVEGLALDEVAALLRVLG